MSGEFSGKHILLLLLYSPGKRNDTNEPVVGRTRMIKMMFLFEKEISEKFFENTDVELVSFPEFYAWHYGPFSKDVYNDIEFFINNNFIKSESLKSKMDQVEFEEYENWVEDYALEDEDTILSTIRNEERFQLTENGIRFVEEKLLPQLTNNQEKILAEFKERINKADLKTIMRYTYLNYSEYTEESKIKDQVLD